MVFATQLHNFCKDRSSSLECPSCLFQASEFCSPQYYRGALLDSQSEEISSLPAFPQHVDCLAHISSCLCSFKPSLPHKIAHFSKAFSSLYSFQGPWYEASSLAGGGLFEEKTWTNPSHCPVLPLFSVRVLSCVWLFVTPRTVAPQAPLSLWFPRQQCWNGLPFPSPGDIPDPGREATSLKSDASAVRFFTTTATWEALFLCFCLSDWSKNCGPVSEQEETLKRRNKLDT